MEGKEGKWPRGGVEGKEGKTKMSKWEGGLENRGASADKNERQASGHDSLVAGWQL